MIDRQRWLEVMQGRLSEQADEHGETAGFHIPQHGSLVLHNSLSAGEAGETAQLMRLVSNEPLHDKEELVAQAQKLEAYACTLEAKREKGMDMEGCALPLYASATPNGRLVANFCACSPFDESEEAVAALDRFLADDPLGSEEAR